MKKFVIAGAAVLALLVLAPVVFVAWWGHVPGPVREALYGRQWSSPRMGAADEVPVERPNIACEPVFEGLEFERPTTLVTAPDGTERMFLLEQAGRVLWFPYKFEAEMSDVEEALDLRDRVRSPVAEDPNRVGYIEEGLLGLAFHPEFADNGTLFLYYSANHEDGTPQRSVISRFRMDEARERILPESEEVLLSIDQPGRDHNGGMLAFGPDGYLYIGLGDGGVVEQNLYNAQDRSLLLGSILRIDVDGADEGLAYAIPPDNPFVDDPEARDEIWAYGFRNPWRFSFDPETGHLWVGDVGLTDREWIHVAEQGGNHGWPYLEGGLEQLELPDELDREALVSPIIAHSRPDFYCITGGHVYTGEAIPELQGVYIYGDWVKGVHNGVDYDHESGRLRRVLELPRISASVSTFGVGPDEELIIVDYQGGLYRFVAR